MDILLVVAGLILCIVGLVGSFLPILPGPISSWSGLFLLNFSSYVNLENKFLLNVPTPLGRLLALLGGLLPLLYVTLLDLGGKSLILIACLMKIIDFYCFFNENHKFVLLLSQRHTNHLYSRFLIS